VTASLFEDFCNLLKDSLSYLTSGSPVAVAVSGGSDSMALCHLLKKWCDEYQFPLYALTVDHGLRAEAADEAILVGEWCASLNIPHRVLKGAGEVPENGIQAYARDLRYGLMEEACKDLGISHLFLGHQQEDQIETFLMRFSRGSGLSGLVSMQSVGRRGELYLHRPLLSVSRHRLRDYLFSVDQDWIEDPSNHDGRYTRTALGPIRVNIASLPGAEPGLLSLSLERMARADQAIEAMVEDCWARDVQVSPLGYAVISSEAFGSIAEEIRLRLMQQLIMTVSGGEFTARLSELERIVADGGIVQAKTVGGCQILPRKAEIFICREPGRKGPPREILTAGSEIHWDQRFLVRDLAPSPLPDEEFAIAAIRPEGFKEVGLDLPDQIAELPAVIRNGLPVVRINEKIVAAPLIWPEIPGTGIARDRFQMVFHS